MSGSPKTGGPSSIREALAGPVPSLRTPFRRDGEVDHAGLREIVEFCLAAGARALMLTAGDSHFLCLSDEEILAVTRTVCEQARGRALIIGADRTHPTTAARRLAAAYRELGVDIHMAQPCDFCGSATEDSFARHYRAVGEILPVMIVTNVFIPRGAAFGLETVRRTLDSGANVVAIKEDMRGPFAEGLCLAEHQRVAILAGGTKQAHLRLLPFGLDGYLSSFLSFRPDIAWRYWRSVEGGDLGRAREIVGAIDRPFFEHIMAYPGGFDAAFHGIGELAGLCGRWRRPPYHSLTDAEMDRLKDFLVSLNLLPQLSPAR